MGDFKTPNFEFSAAVFNRADIIRSIAENITDAEMLDDIISSIEDSAQANICDGNWASLPFIGSVKPNAKYVSLCSNANVLHDAKKSMTRDVYNKFKRDLSITELKRIKRSRSIYYVMQIARNKYKAIHSIKSALKGEKYADLYCYFLNSIKPI